MNDVDDDPVLDLVLGAGDELLGDLGVEVGVTGARSGASQRMRPHDPTVDIDEQFRRGADQAVDGEPVARAERRSQALQHTVAIYRTVGRDGDLPGDHGLGQLPVPDGTPDGLDSGQVGADRRDRLDRVASGRRGRRPDRGQLLGRVVDHGHPRPAIGGDTDSDRRHDHLAGLARVERQPADGDGADPGLGRAVVIDGRQQRRDFVHRGAGRDAATGDPDAVAYEQEAVAAGDIVEDDATVVGGSRDGAHQRVPVMSWVMPPLSSRCSTVRNPAVWIAATSSVDGGR